MASIVLTKHSFIEWAQTQKKKDRKPLVELPAELLNCFKRFEIGDQYEYYEDEEEDDGVTIILHQYPFWAVQDWFYIYQQWSNIALKYTAYYSANYWQDMPSLQMKYEEKVSSITQDSFDEICKGMSNFLYYLFQNDRALHQSPEEIHFEPSGLIQSYINYLCIAFPIV